jgi:hypothetical protein
MATRSPDTFIGKTLQWIGQQHPKLTQQDVDFISRYASMQKFSRGLMDDVGNLSDSERGIARTIVGTPLDNPAVFRSRTNTVIGDSAHAYDQRYRSMSRTRDLSAYPERLGTGQTTSQRPPRGNGTLQPAPQSQQGVQAERRYNPATRTFEEIKPNARN